MEIQNIIITETKSTYKDIREWTQILVSNIILYNWKWFIKYYSDEFSKFNLDNNIPIQFKKWNEFVEIKLWKYFKKNLIDYLNKKWNIEKRANSWVNYVDCIDFSNYMMWITANIKNNTKNPFDIITYLDKNKSNEENLNTPIDISFVKRIEKKSWDIFTLFNVKETKWHDIVYLWEWLYISKFGKWNIYITNIEEILKYYPSNLIWKKKSFFIQWIIWKWIEWKKYKEFNDIENIILNKK